MHTFTSLALESGHPVEVVVAVLNEYLFLFWKQWRGAVQDANDPFLWVNLNNGIDWLDKKTKLHNVAKMVNLHFTHLGCTTGCLSTDPIKVFAYNSDNNCSPSVFSSLFWPFWRYIWYFMPFLAFQLQISWPQWISKNCTLFSNFEFSTSKLKYFHYKH